MDSKSQSTLEQLWLFWLAPIAGAVLAGVVYSVFAESPEAAKMKTAAA